VTATQQTFFPVTPLLATMVIVLTVAAAGVAAAGRLGYSRAVLAAALRAAIQLAAVSVVIAWVIETGALVAAFVLVMYVVASRTAGRRITPHRSGWWAAAVIGAATGPVLALLMVTRLLPAAGVVLIPVAGILIGGALIATVLAGRRALDELAARRGEVEAALALGLTVRDAALEICRPAAAEALVPVLDQTRTVGLVTLPGAFVGMLLGGADPVEAGAVQLFVLVALLAVEATAVLVTIELVAVGRFRRTTTIR
jgi:putative ABC transport system permease protein